MAHPGVIPKAGQPGSGNASGDHRVLIGVGSRVRTVSGPVVVDVTAGHNKTVRAGSIGCGVC
jgi:hypothetical protein